MIVVLKSRPGGERVRGFRKSRWRRLVSRLNSYITGKCSKSSQSYEDVMRNCFLEMWFLNVFDKHGVCWNVSSIMHIGIVYDILFIIVFLAYIWICVRILKSCFFTSTAYTPEI